MKTIFAVAIVCMAFTIGLFPIAIVLLVMGLAGAPGAMLYIAGQKTQNTLLRGGGFILAALGQSYVVGAYAVLVVGVLRWFSTIRPDVPTWPLWLAAYLHSTAVPAYGTRERPDEPTAQHHTLGIVALAATVIFFVVTFTPGALKSLYGWVPFFSDLL